MIPLPKMEHVSLPQAQQLGQLTQGRSGQAGELLQGGRGRGGGHLGQLGLHLASEPLDLPRSRLRHPRSLLRDVSSGALRRSGERMSRKALCIAGGNAACIVTIFVTYRGLPHHLAAQVCASQSNILILGFSLNPKPKAKAWVRGVSEKPRQMSRAQRGVRTPITCESSSARRGTSVAAFSAAASMRAEAWSASSGAFCATCLAPASMPAPSLSAAGSASSPT